MYYIYIILAVYYFFGTSYFIYNDYCQAKKETKQKNIFEINQDELFDKLIENENEN